MTDSSDNLAQSTAFKWSPAVFGDMGRKQFEATIAMQKEVFDTLEQMNRAWLDRAQSEIDLAVKFVGKLAGTRSIPDAVTICQECISQQIEMLGDDGRRMLADGERLLRASTRHLSDGSTEPSS